MSPPNPLILQDLFLGDARWANAPGRLLFPKGNFSWHSVPGYTAGWYPDILQNLQYIRRTKDRTNGPK